MKQILKQAVAGFDEKQDVLVTVEPVASGIEVELTSKVYAQYGKHMEELIRRTVADAGYDGVKVIAQDQAAWDYTIKARVLAALERAARNDENENTGVADAAQSTAVVSAANANTAAGVINSDNELTAKAKERLSRSMMFVPGNTPKMLNSADIYGADSLMFDIEDSIYINEKDSARLLVAEMLKHMKFRSETVVRINHPTQTPYGLDDLDVIVPAKPNLIRLPKTEDVSEVELVARKIEAVEKEQGWPAGTINIIVAIESVKGLYNVREICHAPRVVGIALGAEDYRADLRTGKSKPAVELTLARQTILLAAREAGIRCIDTVFSDVKDTEGFLEEVQYIKALGFDGKSCIHPSQIGLVHSVFTPSAADIEYSVRVLNAYDDSIKHNKGVLAVDGKMIDRPIVIRAERTVDKARAAGIRVVLQRDEVKTAQSGVEESQNEAKDKQTDVEGTQSEGKDKQNEVKGAMEGGNGHAE
ncbi:MAG: citrate lyase subunit gamma [Veillonella sp.]|uniref:aldolase/citrate lyase family protein n=1 Tax=Veillonella sp. TaxID=1926307 RepID=UPI00260154C7|nr:aldolase/citrate lyase family protein [Veillonella sp.]MBS4914329.1 citrate lyase subunit gamma [Veillonella sp.]